MQLNENVALLKPHHLINNLFLKQNEPKFAEIFDDVLLEIAHLNSGIFSVNTAGGEKIYLFENITKYISDNKTSFCKAVINKISKFSFEGIFDQNFDFFSTIFEYLIKDYNSDSGGKYAEYLLACCFKNNR